MEAKEMKAVYGVFLSVPGMSDSVNIHAKIGRKHVLLMAQLLKAGLREEGTANWLAAVTSKETVAELDGIADDFLQKAGLVELHEKLSQLRDK